MIELKELIPSEMKPPLNRTLVVDVGGLSRVSDFLGRVVEFGYDLETNVVDAFTDRKIRTMQVGNRDEQYVIDLLAFAGSTEALMQQGWRTAPDWAKPIVEAVKPHLEDGSKLKVGVNLEFEYITTNWCLGIRPWNFYDCLLVEKIIYAGRVGYFTKDFWGMKPMLARYAGLKMSKDLQTSFDLDTPLTEDQIDYAGLDPRLPFAIRTGQSKAVAKYKLERVIKIENDAIPAFAEMQINGFKLDPEKWTANDAETKVQHAVNVKTLDTHFVSVVGTKAEALPYTQEQLDALEEEWRNTPGPPKGAIIGEHLDDETGETIIERAPVENKRAEKLEAFREARRQVKAWEKMCLPGKDGSLECEGEAYLNYAANDQLLQALRKLGFTEKQLPSTNDKMLSKFSNKPVIQAIQAYRETAKKISTYGLKWLDYINPITGRIHARHIQIGAETGRPSCTAPNLYNLPKEKAYRKCFTARKGKKIATVDESGAELRIIAELSGDQTWIESFLKDWDLHSVCAEKLDPAKWKAGELPDCKFAKTKKKCECPIHILIRDGAKSTNFGVAYGMEVYALAAVLKISAEDASTLLAAWRKENHVVHECLIKLGNLGKMNLCSHTLSGRVRFYKEPKWDAAKEKAQEDCKKYNKLMSPAAVGKKFGSMWGSIERESKNSPIQGTNADITKLAMGSGSDKNGKPFMWHLLPQYGAELVNHVYDECVAEADEDRAEECKEMIGDCFRRAGAELMSSVSMEFEGKVADCWTK